MLRKLHRIIGLTFFVPLLLQGLTGTILLLFPYFMAARPQVPALHTAAVSAENIVSAARPAAPAGMIPLRYDPPRHEGDTAIVTLGPPGERHPTFEVFVDPAQNAVRGTYVIPASFRFLHNLHARFLLLEQGQIVTGLGGAALLFLIVAGVILWWPHRDLRQSGRWVRTLFVSRRARGLRLWREMHNTAGIWTLPVMTFLAFSGVIMAFPAFRPVFGVVRPPVPKAHHTASVGQPGETGLTQALLQLNRDYPDGHLVTVHLTPRPEQQSFDAEISQKGCTSG